MTDSETGWFFIIGGLLVWIFTKQLVAASERTRAKGFGGRQEGKSAKAWSRFSTFTTRFIGMLFILAGVLVLLGIVPVAERTRTLALAAAIAVPFLVGLAWWVWAMVVYDTSPPPADGFPFGPADRVSWVAPVLFGLGPLACVGVSMISPKIRQSGLAARHAWRK